MIEKIIALFKPREGSALIRELVMPYEAAIEPLSKTDRIQGCLYGGAVGDALGYVVEFLSIEAIRKQFGNSGVSFDAISLLFPTWDRCVVSDDTQMTMFTAEGMLAANAAWGDQPSDQRILDGVREAYLDWYISQQPHSFQRPIGQLARSPLMQANRAPGLTCLSACKAGAIGTIARPINDSMGCGGVMRVAPIGFLTLPDASDYFILGAQTAALTHGHSMGYIPAGSLSWLVHQLMRGRSLKEAVFGLEEHLKSVEDADLMRTVLLSAMKIAALPDVTPDFVEVLGGGWVGHECLAIAVLAALIDVPLQRKFEIAINHSGDSDSTAAVLGNLLGAEYGHQALLQIPAYREITAHLDIAPLLGPLIKNLSNWLDSAPNRSAAVE